MVSTGLGGDAAEIVAGQAVHGPFVQGASAEGPVELESGCVPVEDGPLDAAVAAIDGDPSQRGQQSPSVAAAPVFGADVQVLEVDAVTAHPCRERQEPQGEPDDLMLDDGDVGEDSRRRPEEGGAQRGGVELHLVARPLVLGEVAHEAGDGLDVTRFGGSNHGAAKAPAASGFAVRRRAAVEPSAERSE
jgi:hypothetical protein